MKKFDLTRILFLSISIIMLILGIIIPNSNLTASIIGALIIISLVVIDIQAPKISKLSEDNPKVKTMRFITRLTISIFTICAIFIILSPIKLSAKANEIMTVGLVSIFIMIFGNLSPKIPFNRYLGLRFPWTVRDEDTWKVAHKILGYLSFPIAIVMFIASFFFNIDTVVGICMLTWIIVPGLYSLIFYYKKVKGIKL